MNKTPVAVEFTWSEAANLLIAAQQCDKAGWSRAARANVKRAVEKIATALPMDDVNGFFLVVKGQTVIDRKGGGE